MIARGWKAARVARKQSFDQLCIASHLGAEKYVSPISKLKHGEELQMRTGIGIAVVVAIGLIWSVAVMSQWVPVASPEMKSAALIQPHEVNRH